MIVFPPAVLKRLVDHCEKAYPDEACGLIVGRMDADGVYRVGRIEASQNVAEKPGHNFEIDPRLRLGLQRLARDSGEAVIGLYHSHPDGAAQPSRDDLEQAWEPELVWLIAAVNEGQAVHVTAHHLVEAATRFREIPLRTTQWGAYAVKTGADETKGGA